ncbi:uncharacterized protein LOC111040872 [Myzus persicae]|uniref:uncharacterized protein LOC111040872 n=1 Tax=Myzus persicae TaxID=13164 RepID=UPI000B931C00|nr:uncharacterized protein LOC111040872 [Myzus persicae]
MSRIEAMSLPLDYQALAVSQDTDDELKHFIDKSSSLHLEKYVTTESGTQFVSATLKNLAKRFGFTLHPTTNWHPAANGFIERMHRQLKAAIMTHAKDSWTESLPIELLGMRSSLKKDLKATSAELVYGEPLNHPGDYFADNQENSSMNDPTSLLDCLRILMNKIGPVPASRHSNSRSFVFVDLKD